MNVERRSAAITASPTTSAPSGRPTFLALALVHAGFSDVRNYFGSFGEWSRDLACPVEPGPDAELPESASSAITER